MKKLLLTIFAIILLASCQAPTISTGYDRIIYIDTSKVDENGELIIRTTLK